MTTTEWVQAVEENRDDLEDIAESDLPCADIARELLRIPADVSDSKEAASK